MRFQTFFTGSGTWGAAHRTAERVEDLLRGVVNDRSIEQVAVTERLAVEQQAFGVLQQPVVMHQVGEVFGAIEKLVRRHAFRHFERNGTEGRNDFARSALHVRLVFQKR